MTRSEGVAANVPDTAPTCVSDNVPAGVPDAESEEHSTDNQD